jgi:hypothetical protein
MGLIWFQNGKVNKSFILNTFYSSDIRQTTTTDHIIAKACTSGRSSTK